MARTARFTESVSAMVPEDHKAFLLGSAETEEVSEGDVLRSMIETALAHLVDSGQLDSNAVEARMTKGRELLAARPRKGGG